MDLAPKPPEKTDQSANARRLGDEAAGLRLDCALSLLVKEGLRGRRRRIKEGSVLVNGLPCCEPARRLKAGDLLGLAGKPVPSRARTRLLTVAGDFCFFFKDAGLHTAALAGKDDDSLEARLPELCEAEMAERGLPLLLQRLDEGTSGLVCAALTPEAAKSFRNAEAAGLCEKRYLALLQGGLGRPLTARWRLDTRKRRATRLLAEEAEPCRWTEFQPLVVWRGDSCARLLALLQPTYGLKPGKAPEALTLAGCRIRRGARHQIRVHAAALGHPLLGDALYGEKDSLASGRFFLHHGFLDFPGGKCSVATPWLWLWAWGRLNELLSPAAQALAHPWLKTAEFYPY